MWALALAAALLASGDGAKYAADVRFLLDELEQKAGHLFAAKGIDWKAVRKEFTAAAKGVREDAAHVELCSRLVARLRDGHAGLEDVAAGIERSAESAPEKGVGLSLCVEGKKVYVADCFGPAAAAGIEPGFEVLEIDDRPARAWLAARSAELADRRGYSTDHAALYDACHRGLAAAAGTTWSFALKPLKGGTKKVSLTCASGGGNGVPVGPLAPPRGAEALERQSYAKLESGAGWIHLRKVPEDLPDQLDRILAALGDVSGLVLDFRANGGGGCDHDAVVERLKAAGKPVVLIADAGTLSAGETLVGRIRAGLPARLIGPSPTAGMSGAKEVLEVPSKLFRVRFVVRSYRECDGGKEIEGRGIEPDEHVAVDPKALNAGVDPYIRRAEELLARP